MAEVMVRKYLSKSPKLASADPLEYWSHETVFWTDLSWMDMSLLFCPPTNVKSKLVFSDLGNILSAYHSLLDPSRVDKLAFLSVNLSLLDYPYLDLTG